MRVLITRPAAQAASWLQALTASGIDAVAVPLIEIVPPADRAEINAAWGALPSMTLAVFVSPNAAECFFAPLPTHRHWPPGVLAATVGPGTTDLLATRLGVPAPLLVEPPREAAQFDSEALWRVLSKRPWQGARVLIVRGDGGREWLADKLRAQGAEVSFCTAYRREVPRVDPEGLQRLDAAIAQPQEHLWFFSSSESIENLMGLRPGVDWSAARSLVTHPRIAARARQCGFGVVHESRPTLDAVIACIQSIAS